MYSNCWAPDFVMIARDGNQLAAGTDADVISAPTRPRVLPRINLFFMRVQIMG